MSNLHPEYNSRRLPVYARRGIVASSQPLASQARLEILMMGDNTANAAVFDSFEAEEWEAEG